MRAAEPSPKNYREKRNTVPEKPNQLNIPEAVELEFRYEAAANQAMEEVKQDLIRGKGAIAAAAFKFSSHGVVDRQEGSSNAMDKLGGSISPRVEGKFVPETINLKPTEPVNLYH